MNYDQLLFSELRLVAITDPGEAGTGDELLLKAMTVNVELLALGYTLSAQDVVRLSQSPDCDGLVSRIREYVGDVKAKPMYPDFPNQVMEMDEALFRFHQMIHYFSTYDIESLFGVKVSRGWLPSLHETGKYAADDTLLAAKTVALISEQDKYILPYRKILSKTERMDEKEKLIIAECIDRLSPEQLSSVKVKFKQNLLDVFNTVFVSAKLSSEEKLSYLHALCQHTGDVWKCMDYALTRAKFHFRTSQKRLIVKLLESYPLGDFKANLILSNKKGERTLLMLKFIDFNEYTRAPGFKETVAEFRGGKLRSWESRAKYLVDNHIPEALDYYIERPGIMLRHLTYLFRNGYRIGSIYEKLAPKAASLSTQTLVNLENFFKSLERSKEDDLRYTEASNIARMLDPLLSIRLAANDTPLRGKKIFVDMPEFDLGLSTLRVSDKSAEGGYIRSGLAYRIPEAADRIRFFVYWNDKNRVDVDLHASAQLTNGETQNIGWNANFRDGALVFSGDITHSDAAEYIDVDLVKARDYVDSVTMNINLFSGYSTFAEIDECFVGIMAVKKTGEEITLYDPKNCFFTHYLKSKCRMLNYGFVDVRSRVLVFDGAPNNNGGSVRGSDYYDKMVRNTGFSLADYLDLLLGAQNSERVYSADEADLVLVMGKPSQDREISLIDNNFFME